MTEWKTVKLGDICDVRDGTHDSPKQSLEGKFLVTSKHIKGGKIDLSSAYKISLEDFNFVNQRSKVEQWDILISMIGTVGEICLICTPPDFAIKNVGLIKAGNKDLAQYLFYYLKSPISQNDIETRLKGTTQQYLSLSEIRDFPVFLPPLEIQRKIAGILGALDDRIDVLRRENVVLEQMAQAVFQSWFVDFDIVHAKAAGMSESEVCEKYHITPELYALFPSALTPDNLPLGWEKKNLGDISQYSKEKTTNVNIETYVSTENMLPNYGGIEKASSVPETGQSTRYKAGNVLISNIRPYFKKIWFADREGNCSNDVLVFFSNSIGKCMLYSILAQDAFFDFVMSGANGDKMPRGNKKHIMTYPVIFPNMDLLNKFESLVASLFDKKSKNTQQIRALSATRNTLLPQLISGKLIF